MLFRERQPVRVGLCNADVCSKPILWRQQPDIHGVNSNVRPSGRRDCHNSAYCSRGKFERAAQCDGLLPVMGAPMDEQLIAAFWHSSSWLLTRPETATLL